MRAAPGAVAKAHVDTSATPGPNAKGFVHWLRKVLVTTADDGVVRHGDNVAQEVTLHLRELLHRLLLLLLFE